MATRQIQVVSCDHCKVEKVMPKTGQPTAGDINGWIFHTNTYSYLPIVIGETQEKFRNYNNKPVTWCSITCMVAWLRDWYRKSKANEAPIDPPGQEGGE